MSDDYGRNSPPPLRLHKLEPISGFDIQCALLSGGSIRDCKCRIADGWLECPPEARGALVTAERIAERKEWLARSRVVTLATAFSPPGTPPNEQIGIFHDRNTDLIPEPKTPDQIAATVRAERLAAATMARQIGYTGNFCPQCHSTHMKMNGTCEVCEDCGAQGGCS